MFLTTLLSPSPRAATPENPRFSLNDPAAWDALGAQPAASGVRVNRSTALTYSPYFRALSLISGAFAKLPCTVYRRQGKGKVDAPEHRAYQLLRWKPNQNLTAFAWKRVMQVQSLAEGNAYSFIMRDSFAAPLELLPLDPLKTFPVKENGRLWYVTEVGTEKRKLLPEDVLHFAGVSYDGMMGLSITECAREALGLGMGAQRYGSVFFKNNARPSVVLTHPNKLDPKTKNSLVEGWERMQTSLDNAHRTALLDGGLGIKELSINADDAQLLELMIQNGIDIANYFDLPPHKIGNRGATSYNSLEQENQAFLDDCLDPRLIFAEEQMRDKLLTEEEKSADTHVIQFDRKGLIKANMQTRSAYFRTALGGRPWMTQNEVREEESLNPSDDPQADDILEPLNMGKGGADNEPATDDAPGKGEAPGDKGGQGANAEALALALDLDRAALVEAQRPILVETVRRMVGRVANHKGQLAKAVKTPAAFCAWLDGLEAEHGPAIAAALGPVAEACAAAAGHTDTSLAGWLLATIKNDFSSLADNTTPKELPAAAGLRVLDLLDRLPREAADIFLGDHPCTSAS